MNNPSLFELLLIGFLATYRLTLLITDEAGPFDIFGKFRHFAGVRYDEYSRKTALNGFAEGLICFYCCSVWVGAGAFVVLALSQFVPALVWLWLVLVPFALSKL